MLRDRLYRGALELHYQPVVDLRSGKPDLVEALARLRMADGTLASPVEFLPGFGGAELVRLFQDGLHQTLAQLQAWDAQGLKLVVSLNLPPAVLVQRECAIWVQQALLEHGIAPSRLRLELLETEEVCDASRRDRAVAAIAGLGVPLVMDDLGSGYSSLLRLRTLPFSVVKIDQGLVREAPRDPLRVIGFIGSLVRLAQSLDLRVVVEGLESPALVETAAILGADAGQGYALARPMPAADVRVWMHGFSLHLDPLQPQTALGALAAHWSWEHGVRHAGARAMHDEGTCALGSFIMSQGLGGSDLDIAHRQMHQAAVEQGTDSAQYKQWAQHVVAALMAMSDGAMGATTD
uniref:EAL domain-containing protein n=1 Tax=mine drainage metagenome TaxID=410659 RepID=E6PJG4_9ZZZZ